MRNIVLCCDGTSNEFSRDNTNVVKLFQILRKDPASQLRYYDPGVGTFASPGALLPITKRATRILGLAIGLGLLRNVEEAYAYLMEHWRAGDRLFIFGFSRGAYTARVIAGLLYRCGLLDPGQEQLVPYASKVFRQVTRASWRISHEFGDTFGRPCPVHFLGLWDTVSSVGWVWDPKSYPFTRNNPGVEIVRHAVALDERRAFFRQNLWGKDPKLNPKLDLKEVWFPGVHCDVGGGYPADRSGLSQIALQWMVTEAQAAGLEVDPAKRNEIFSKPEADCLASRNESLRGLWRIAEFYPKQVHREVERADGSLAWETSYRMNQGQPREVAPGSRIHESVLQRMEQSSYTPRNLPGVEEIRRRYQIEPETRAS